MRRHRLLVLCIAAVLAAAAAAAAAPTPPAPEAPGLSAWQQGYHQTRAARPERPSLPALMAAARRGLRPGEIPLAVLCEGGGLAAAALAPATHRGRQAAFVLDASRVFCGPGADPRDFAIDPGDGEGWRPLRFGEPVPASYGRTGRHPVRVRATLPDGAVVEASFSFEVAHLLTPLPDDTLAVTASVPYAGAAGSGHGYVYLAPGHATIEQPVVVLEGLDLDNSMGWDEFYWLLNQQGLIEDLRGEGYDAVVLDFADATTYLQRNAFVAVELLQQVAAIAGPQAGCALVGASMGGVVGRYALAWMESQGLPHQVLCYISFDSPHRGGNVPLGLQYWVQFFAPRSAAAALMLAQLESPAARQLLAYHATSPPSTTPAADPLRAGFLSDLAAVGSYPAQPRLAALANGSGTAAGQGYAAGAQLVLYEYYSFFVDIIGNVWAVPDGGSATIFRGVIDQIWPLPDTGQTVTVSGTLPYDNAPGGWRASMAVMDTTAVDYGDIVALQSNHCFIPIISALDLEGAGLFHDVAGDPLLQTRTPFQSLFWAAANEEHMTISAAAADWLRQEIHFPLTAAWPVADAAPRAPVLLGNAPNPFNPATTIAFELPAAAATRLEIRSLDGRLVRTVLRGRLEAGPHGAVWDGCDGRGRAAASGVYLCRLVADGTTVAKKISLIR